MTDIDSFFGPLTPDAGCAVPATQRLTTTRGLTLCSDRAWSGAWLERSVIRAALSPG